MDFYFIIGVCATGIGLWNLMIAILGLFPQCRATVAGTLSYTRTQRNVRSGKAHTRIPILTDYTYTYYVKNKKYNHSGQVFRTKRHLLSRVSMVYVKRFPRHAYPNRFKGTNEWSIAAVMFLIGIPAILAAIF